MSLWALLSCTEISLSFPWPTCLRRSPPASPLVWPPSSLASHRLCWIRLKWGLKIVPLMVPALQPPLYSRLEGGQTDSAHKLGSWELGQGCRDSLWGLGGGSASWVEDVRASHPLEEVFPSSKEQTEQKNPLSLRSRVLKLVRSPRQSSPFELLNWAIFVCSGQIRRKGPGLGGPQSFLLGLELRWTTSHTAATFCHPPTPRTQPRVLAFLKLLPIFLVSQYLLVSPDPFSNRPLPIVFSANTPKTPFVLRAFLLITKLKALSVEWSRAA